VYSFSFVAQAAHQQIARHQVYVLFVLSHKVARKRIARHNAYVILLHCTSYCGLMVSENMANVHAMNALHAHLSVGDGVIVKHNNKMDVGKTVKAHGDGRVSISLFFYEASALILWHSLAPVTETELLLAAKSRMVEVILMQNTIKVPRSSIVDITFIVPL
jgi:hypothetical protein